MESKILVVDDEKSIVDILRYNLKKEGYKVIEAYDGEEAVRLALELSPDLILLDVMLQKFDGFTVCRKIREKLNVPIIMLTAREEEVDKVLGLELGADDYITKPFSNREVMARVKANLRRVTTDLTYLELSADATFFEIGEITIDLERYEAKKNGKVLELTLREFELLKFLAMQPDKVCSRSSLLQNVWGYDYYGDLRTVDVTVRRVREKIEDDPAMPTYLITKRGVGYYFAKR